jgi:hypothetical protein
VAASPFACAGSGVDALARFTTARIPVVAENLWDGSKTVALVLADHASQTDANTVEFDFGGGNILSVVQAGITIAALQDDIMIIV